MCSSILIVPKVGLVTGLTAPSPTHSAIPPVNWLAMRVLNGTLRKPVSLSNTVRARRSSTNSLARFAGSTSASIVGSSVLPTVAFSRKRITCSGSLRLLAISKALTELPALNSFCESTRARIALAKPMPSGRFDFTCMLVPAVCGCGSPSAVAAACFSFLPATGVASDADF